MFFLCEDPGGAMAPACFAQCAVQRAPAYGALPRADSRSSRHGCLRSSAKVEFAPLQRANRAVSSAVEHYLDMVGVTGSNPVPPTTLSQRGTFVRQPSSISPGGPRKRRPSVRHEHYHRLNQVLPEALHRQAPSWRFFVPAVRPWESGIGSRESSSFLCRVPAPLRSSIALHRLPIPHSSFSIPGFSP